MPRPSTLERAARFRRREDRQLVIHFALLTFLGGSVGPIFAMFLGFAVFALLPPAFGASLALAGVALIFGATQGAVLLPRFGRWPAWLLGTVVGGTPGLWLFLSSGFGRHDVAGALGIAALGGLVLGLGQALALRPLRVALLPWVAGTTLAGVLARVTWLPLFDHSPVVFLVGPAVGLALGQTIGLAVLLVMLRRRADDTP